MSQRDLFYKWLFYSLLGLFWLSLQQLVLNHVSLWGGLHPFILPMVPAIAAIFERRQEASFYAIGAGLLCDLLLPGSFPGLYTLAFLLSSLLAGVIAARVIVRGFLCACVCSIVALVLGSFFQALFLSSAANFTFATTLSLTGRELFLSLPAFPLLFLSFRKVYRRIRNE